MYKQTIIIDNGSLYSKMGFGGNLEPTIVIPTAILNLEKKNTSSVSTKSYEYNYYIGDEAINKARESKDNKLIYPMKNGIDWDLMEKYWYKGIYDYLKCDPEEQYFVLTEPIMNPPENRKNMEEIFFETFNVPGLYIENKASLSLFGLNYYLKDNNKLNEEQENAIKSLTGIVVYSGDEKTYIVTICDGYIIQSKIKQFPIAGKHITKFIEQMIRERGEQINSEDLYDATMEVKEKFCYLSRDLITEFSRFDKKENIDGKLTQSSKFKKYEGIGKISSKPFSINVGYESFLGPESFFSPEIIDNNCKQSLDEIIDLTIQQCDIQYTKRLYANILFIGGSTLFKNLDRKLELCLQNRVDKRLDKYNSGKQNSVNVKVSSIPINHRAWYGGSAVSSEWDFKEKVHTREKYLEKGPSF